MAPPPMIQAVYWPVVGILEQDVETAVAVEIAETDKDIARRRRAQCIGGPDRRPMHHPVDVDAAGTLEQDVGVAVAVDVGRALEGVTRARIADRPAADDAGGVNEPDRDIAAGVLEQDVARPVVVEIADADDRPGAAGIGERIGGVDRSSRHRPVDERAVLVAEQHVRAAVGEEIAAALIGPGGAGIGERTAAGEGGAVDLPDGIGAGRGWARIDGLERQRLGNVRQGERPEIVRDRVRRHRETGDWRVRGDDDHVVGPRAPGVGGDGEGSRRGVDRDARGRRRAARPQDGERPAGGRDRRAPVGRGHLVGLASRIFGIGGAGIDQHEARPGGNRA